MIRCGAFFYSTDRERLSAAAKGASRMTVAGARPQIFNGPQAGLPEEGGLVVVGYGGEGLPAVHGWVDDRGPACEYSMLSGSEGGLVAMRDHCGTRPLYVGSSGSWVASDHRFLPGEEMELLPRGATWRVSDGETVPGRNGGRFVGTFEEAVSRLAALIDGSVGARVQGARRVAVAFSGGLDSSLLALCAARHCKVVACSVSVQGSRDSEVARDAALSMGLEFASFRADESKVKRELSHMDLPFEPTPMDRSLWCIYSMTARLAAESGAELVMLGQLADELFGGYAKYESALRSGGEAGARDAMAGDLAGCALRGFVRDEAACRSRCEPRFPFADRSVAEFGEGLPVSFKVREGARKAVLREAALELGLPAEIASRPKKAAQYSSGVMKLLS